MIILTTIKSIDRLFTERITVLYESNRLDWNFVGGPGAETWTSELDRIGWDRSHFVYKIQERTGLRLRLRCDWTGLDWTGLEFDAGPRFNSMR